MVTSSENEINLLLPAVEQLPEPSVQTVGMGRDRAQSYILHLIRNEKINGEKKKIGLGILKALHRQVLFFFPGWAGQYRANDDIRVGGKERKLVKARDLDDKVYLFESWLEREVDQLREKPENLYGALKTAAAAHYCITGELHPFDEGNGRVARTLVNGLLMMNTREGLFHGFYILPVPLLRDQIDVSKLEKMLLQGREPKLSPYLQALEEVGETWQLNPLEVYFASRWIDSIAGFLDGLERKYRKTKGDKAWKQRLNDMERKLVDKVIERRRRLFEFIEDNRAGRYPADPVPDFFAARHLSASRT